MITHFWDMHSGGSAKLDWTMIFIEAPKDEAVNIFYNRFGRNPHRVTCTCCGSDYSIDEHGDIDEATRFHRKDSSRRIDMTVDEYLAQDYVLFITKDEISADEKKYDGILPEEGYVWVGG